jgi:AraC-like DNA-binding protein
MRDDANVFRSETGIVGYDDAKWIGGLPRLNLVKNAWGMSTLLQCGVDSPETVMEADVPAGESAVSLFRIASPAAVSRRVGGRAVQASYRTGEGCLLAPGTDSWWGVDHETTNGWFHIHFDRDLLKLVESTHNLKLETTPHVANSQITGLVGMIFEVVSREDEPEPLLWQSLAQVLLWRLMLLTAGNSRSTEARGGLAQWQARRTTEYLADNLARRVTLEELAEVARLSPFHFARAFSKTIGMPPYRYLRKLRIDRACELLANSPMRISDVALAVGYDSPQALARVFTRVHGVAPSQWRKRHGRY